MEQLKYHIPVLLSESMAGLAVNPNGTYVDLTFGGGGHSRRILELLDEGRLIGFDQDPEAAKNQLDDPRFHLVPHNFQYLSNFLRYLEIEAVDGILADLGVSSHHLDAPERGFSFRFDAKLDMRMNPGSQLSAYDVINHYSLDDLTRVLKTFGEIDRAYPVAKQIVHQREQKPIETTTQLVECVKAQLKRGKENKELARIFQAIRIEVNREMAGLERMLNQVLEYLKPGGRLVVIAYHSLEDRMVKNFMRSGNTKGEVLKDFYGAPLTPFKLINRKVILPSEEELERNPRGRSAKLRIAERIG